MKILVADDDPQILKALRITLSAFGHQVITAEDGAAALRRAADQHPDIVVLDLGMPHFDGLEVIAGIRGWSKMPILVVSGRVTSGDKVEALDAGADDYVTKPFSTEELLARIRALTRRTPLADKRSSVGFANIRVDFSATRVTRIDTGHTVRLTPTEWKLLEVLLRFPDRLVTQQALLEQVWGPHHAADGGYLRLYIGQLRKKLEPEPARPRYFITEPGMGYRFVPDGTPAGTPAGAP